MGVGKKEFKEKIIKNLSYKVGFKQKRILANDVIIAKMTDNFIKFHKILSYVHEKSFYFPHLRSNVSLF